VLRSALEQSRAWRAAGLALPVAVNLSMRNLHDPRLPEAVGEILEQTGVEPRWLKLEVTESGMMADPVRAMDNLARLREMGVSTAIDDFGTGYSSLSYLKRLPIDEFKIDKSFTRDMVANESDAAIVRASIDLGHHLGLTVVAEGIEDEATWNLLVALKCDIGQGYFLSRPLAPEDLIAWARTWR
jgi:EAL domain-containing protein (putative c-di-GMP-specific phosphodiesterase class I)